MKFSLICLLFLLQELLAQGSLSLAQTKGLPQPYSHRQRVKYSFQPIGRIHLQLTDSLPKGLLPSFAVFRDGSLSFGDYLDSKVKISSSDGKFVKSISSKGSGPGETQRLIGHCIDDSGRVWISDYGLNRVSIYDASGALQETWSPLNACNDCYFSTSGRIRVTNNRIYIGIIKAEPNPAEVKTISSLVTAFDFNRRPLAEYGKPAKNIKDYSVGFDHYEFDLDSSGNLYGAHQYSYDIWKYSPDGKILQRFNYPVNEYRPANPQPPMPIIPDSDCTKKLREWYTSITTIGKLEIAGKYLFISFANKDRQWADDFQLRHWHEYLQVFDLNGNCLVDCFELPGQFLCCDHSGILYFRETDAPKGTIISKYRFSVIGY